MSPPSRPAVSVISASMRGAPPPPGISIRVATERDLPFLAALREAVGWRVHAWALRDVLRFSRAQLLVAEAESRIIGSGSGVAYGEMGVVGNMVIAPEWRRRGIGRVLLDSVLAFLDERGVRQVELYATAEGAHLYAAAGFVKAGTNLSVRIPRQEPAAGGVEITRATPADLAELAAYDSPRFGGDRRDLLAAAIADRRRSVLLARDGSRITGYATLQPEATVGRIGPWLADDTRAAQALLGGAFEASPGEPELSSGMPIENVEGGAWLRTMGAEMQPWDGRMRLGAGARQDYQRIFGIMVGALG